MSKRIKPRLVKLHRSYSVNEAADLFGIHSNTVRNWIKNENLDAIKEGGTWIIVGHVLREFLEKREQSLKKPTNAGEIHCLKCKSNQRPAGRMIEYQPYSNTNGMITAICPECDRIINQFGGPKKLMAFEQYCDITIISIDQNTPLPSESNQQPTPRIHDTTKHPLNSDFGKVGK